MAESSENQNQRDVNEQQGPAKKGLPGWLFLVILVVIIILFVLVKNGREQEGVVVPVTENGEAVGGIAWTTDYEAALETAQVEDKPLLLAFHAKGCPPCEQMKRTTYHDAEVVAASENFVCVMIDVHEQPSVAQRYGVQAWPTYVLTDKTGKPLNAFLGYHGSEAFRTELSKVQEG